MDFQKQFFELEPRKVEIFSSYKKNNDIFRT